MCQEIFEKYSSAIVMTQYVYRVDLNRSHLASYNRIGFKIFSFNSFSKTCLLVETLLSFLIFFLSSLSFPPMTAKKGIKQMQALIWLSWCSDV